jgi:enamine deaminase RidA (YjgF/YER057c/UK114 family)
VGAARDRRAEAKPLKSLEPSSIRPPFARYSHGIVVPEGARLVYVSGQLGVTAEDVVPESVEEQAEICFENIAAILAEAGMDLADIVQIRAFVTDRAHMRPYMNVRDRTVGSPPPASTLMIVGGFTRPEMKVEIEVVAARAP